MKRILSVLVILLWATTALGGMQAPRKLVTAASGGTTYTDNFNRAPENPLASPWGQVFTDDQPRIVDNALYSSSSAVNYTYYNQATNADQYSQIKLLSTNNDQGVLLRVDNSRTNEAKRGYQVFINDGTLYIRRWFDGGFSNIASVAQAVSVNDVLKGTVSGTTIKAYINGSEKLSTTDATYSSGYVGLSVKDQFSAAMDDFEGGNL